MKYIAYYRVSTQKQGISGLGLASQKEIVSNFIKHQNVTLCGEFTEILSGKVNDRPALMEAILTSQNTGATLIVAKLDRLSRSVSFISQLMESKIKFVVAENPQMNELTCHIMAALAEHERKLISQRTKDALKAKRQRQPEWRPGTNNLSDIDRQNGQRTNFLNARNDKAVRHALHYITILKDQGHSYNTIANKLNSEGYRTRTGKSFHAQQVYNIWTRFAELEGKQNEPSV